MHIENLLNIIDGTSINEAKVEKIESATIYPSKVDLGDLYFAYEKENIQKAVDNGAYAVVYEGEDPEITDREIAYIKVNSIKEATIKFLRYVLIQKESQIYHFQDIEYSLIKQISYTRSTLFTLLPDNWQKSFELILNSDYEIFITTNAVDAKNLSPTFKTLKEKTDGYIVTDTLLRSTIRVENFVYQNIELSPLFFENLTKVIYFCKANDIPYEINRVKYTKEFLPYYIESDLTPVNKGTTEKVLIFTKSTKTIDRAIQYLRHQGKWIKNIALTPPKTKLENLDKPKWYHTVEEAREVLKNEHFHYAFCYEIKPKDIFVDKEEKSTLFN